MPAFGRLPEFDERSRNYPIRQLLGPRRAPRSKEWECESHLDQGYIGACVGFSWAHELVAEPEIVSDINEDDALALYYRAQELDEWPGSDYEGTSVLAGAKATMERGHLFEYRWAFGIDDLLETVSYLGPVIIGVNWYAGMMNPDSRGFITPSGDVLGGHATLIKGVEPLIEAAIIHNSWGPTWGTNGDCYILWDDLERLLHEEGECCVPVTRVMEPIIDPIDPAPVDPEPIEPQPAGCLPRVLRKLFISE